MHTSSRPESRRLVNLAGAFAVVASDVISDAGSGLDFATNAESAALNLVGHAPSLSIDELSRAIMLSHAGTVRLVDRLVSAGLVQRLPGRNRRTVALRLTASGSRHRRVLQKHRLGGLDALLEPLESGERTTLEGMLAKLLASHVRDGETAAVTCRFCDEDACTSCPVEAALGASETR